MTKDRFGFTIVELLIVIAIIGVLTSVILPRFQNARTDGVETKIKTELTIVGKRASVEEGKVLTYDIVCGSGTYTQADSIADIISAIESFSGETVICRSTASSYAVSVLLDVGRHWCVDSSGAKIERATSLGAMEFTCE